MSTVITNGMPVKMRARQLVHNIVQSRAELWKNVLDSEKRDLDISCGYPTVITVAMYQSMFDRFGLARRIVSFFPKESWSVNPIIYDDEDPEVETPFEKSLSRLVKRKCLYSLYKRADIVAGIGNFGIILYGLNDNKPLNEPVDGFKIDEEGKLINAGAKLRLNWTQTYGNSSVQPATYEEDTKHPRFGLPTSYEVRFFDPHASQQTGTGAIPQTTSAIVNWTRVEHIAEDRLTSDTFAEPKMKGVFNHLLDLRKILGGSAEMFWKGGFPGIAFEVDPAIAAEIEIDDDMKAELKDQMSKYANDLERWFAVQGMKANMMAPAVADPTASFETQVTAICLAMDVPKRKFMGSEQGELASSQDDGTHNKRMNGRNNEYLTPYMLRPSIERLVAFGCVEPPKDDEFECEWPDLNAASDVDKANIAKVRTEALKNYIAGNCNLLVPPLEFLTEVYGMDIETAKQCLEAAMEEIAFTAAIHPSVDPQTGKPLPPGHQAPQPKKDKFGKSIKEVKPQLGKKPMKKKKPTK